MAEEECGLHLTKIKNISVYKDEKQIINNVSFDVHCGEITMIIGKNGAGKTTILKAILNEIPHKGEVEFFDMKESRQKKIKIGYVPQAINIERDMPLTTFDLFASYISKAPVWLAKTKANYNKVKNALKTFGVEKLIDMRVGNVSGGELQRILLSIATYDVPNLLILDEPVSGIDRNGTIQVYEILSRLKTEFDMSILLVSHDFDLVKKYADKVILLDQKIVKYGTPKEVFGSEEYKERFERKE